MKYRIFFTVSFEDNTILEADNELDARVEFDLHIAQYLADLKPTVFDAEITDILENPSQPPVED
jgi:hypothetical protein